MFRLVLAVAIVLGLGLGEARADSKGDWSQFIEKPGDKPPPVTHTAAIDPVPKAPAKSAKTAKATKKPAAKPKKQAARKHK
jgi:hypothetical protein